MVDREGFLQLLADADVDRHQNGPRPAVEWVHHMDDGDVYFAIDADPDWWVSPAFADVLCEHARCTDCGAPPDIDLSPCPCRLVADSTRLEYRVDKAVWRTELAALWDNDRRRVSDWHKRRARRARKKESPDPSYTTDDVAMLRSIQADACYYCGTSVSDGFEVDHLEPLFRGGSDGVRNIMLACRPCNRQKWIHSERKFWWTQKRRFSPEEFARIREAAKAMKKERNWRIRQRDQVTIDEPR